MSEGYTELQIWRRSSDSVYMYTKVGSTTIMVGAENDSQLYEYPLETPLAFQEGDILGFFQPNEEKGEMSLHLEDSSSLTTYYDMVMGMGIEPPGEPFNLNSRSVKRGDEYPLVGLETGIGISTILLN